MAACAGAPAPAPEPAGMAAVAAWAIQLSGIDEPGAVDRLARADADLVVVDAVDTVRGKERYPMRAVVAQIRATRGRALDRKLCLAYVNVGQAESYRAYWGEAVERLVVGKDPEGWTENYPVRYWEPAWRDVLIGSGTALVDRAVAGGYDGIFLDWVAGFEDAGVIAAARAAGVDPARAMADLVREVARYARLQRKRFLVVANGGEYLVAAAPDASASLTGIAAESVSFSGRAGSAWEAADTRDLPVAGDVDARMAALGKARDRGLAVLVLDYASKPENVAAAEKRARDHGFVPFVSRTPLNRLPDRAVRR